MTVPGHLGGEGRVVYVLSFHTGPDAFAGYQETFQEILESFRLRE